MLTKLEQIDETEHESDHSDENAPQSGLIEYDHEKFGGYFNPNDPYGVNTRCDPPSEHSSDDELGKNGRIYNFA